MTADKKMFSAEGISIRHSIPGRMRVRVEAVREDRERAAALERWIEGRPGVTAVEAKPITGSVIVLYDQEIVALPEILDQIAGWITLDRNSEPVGRPSKAPTCDAACPACRANNHGTSFFARAVEVVALTAFMAYALIRDLVFGAPLSQGPAGLVAVVSVLGAIPLFRHAWKDMREGRHMTLFPFLALTTLIAVFVGEAMTALEVIWILRVGMLLEDYVAERSRQAIREILQVAAKDTFVIVDGVEVQIPVEQVRPGDTVACHTGEKIPVDGIVTRGEAMVDEASITGRAEPEHKKEGDRVFAGTIVQQGVVFINAGKVGDETYLSRILHMVEGALENRAPAEKRADVLAARLMKIGAAAILGTFLLTLDPVRAFTVLLVIACPCATVLAASTAVSAALANAARNRILIKGGLYLERIGEADCFCFDKTGTLTAEVPRVIDVVTRSTRQGTDDVLALAAAAEAHNPHPLAQAILFAAKEHDITPRPHAVCDFVLGKGVRARVGKDVIFVGNQAFMAEEGVDVTYFRRKAEGFVAQGNSVVYVARNGKAQGLIAMANTVRPGAREVIGWLREDGVRDMHLITGDAEPVAAGMAREFAFPGFRAALLPEDKADYVEALEKRGRRVVMVGDGVNDALALARASVGVAMGAGGAEVAIEAADIALVDSDLERIVKLRQLSHQTIRIIEQNHWLAVSTNIGGVALGAAGILTPLMAGALHIVHTLGIMLNSSRLLAWEPPGLGKNPDDQWM